MSTNKEVTQRSKDLIRAQQQQHALCVRDLYAKVNKQGRKDGREEARNKGRKRGRKTERTEERKK